jgi:guanylate kinase
MTANSQGNILVVTGPSGVGKGTITERILTEVPNLAKSVSVTTREKRAGETEGHDYFYRSETEFRQMVDANDFLEWAEFAGSFYGTPKSWVEAQIAKGTDVILEIEVQGAMQVAELCPQAVFIFVSPPSFEALHQRLLGRATETPEKIALRLSKARQELTQRHLFDYEVVNDNVEQAVNNMKNIVYAERCRIKDARKSQ